MKTFLVAFVLTIGYSLTCFAQLPSGIFADNRFQKFKIGKPGIAYITDSLTKGKLDIPFNTKNRLLNDPKEKEMKIDKLAENNLMVQGGMPILKPEGSFPMPVYLPDSTINFTMRIKEYKGIPPVDFK